jgi:hypothetical protein
MNYNNVSYEKKHNATVTIIEINPQLQVPDHGGRGRHAGGDVQMGLLRFNCEYKKTGSIDYCIFYTKFNEKA